MRHQPSSVPAWFGPRAGDWVVVRSEEEILATLDEHGCLEALPFHSEMFESCGQRMRVSKVPHKTCDNLRKIGGRRMRTRHQDHRVDPVQASRGRARSRRPVSAARRRAA